MAEKEQPIEKQLERLEKIVEQLETGEVSLEKSISLYEEGKKLSAACSERLHAYQKRIEIVIGQANGELKTEPFEEGQD